MTGWIILAIVGAIFAVICVVEYCAKRKRERQIYGHSSPVFQPHKNNSQNSSTIDENTYQNIAIFSTVDDHFHSHHIHSHHSHSYDYNHGDCSSGDNGGDGFDGGDCSGSD